MLIYNFSENSQEHIVTLYKIRRLLKILINIQIEAFFNLILFIILYIHRSIKKLIKSCQKESEYQQLFNYFVANQELIIQNILLFILNPTGILWYIVQAYTLLTMINKSYDEANSNFLSSFFGLLRAIIVGQLK
uniref:Transmembrane protein n=1 Tax=Babesia motasi TaxID=237580 RepID=A0A411ADE9_9APIC|nr:hypothetical protein [Babesia motasi]QAX27133.1 hypothetical protein [Babesia motasi]